MKITFEGAFNDILDQMAALLERSGIKISTETYAHAQGPGPQTAVAPLPQEVNPAPVDNSGEKPKLSKSEVAARMMAGKAAKAAERAAEAERVAAEKVAAKVAAAQKMRDAKDAKKTAKAAPAADEPAAEDDAEGDLFNDKPPAAAPVDPADMVKNRLKTIEDLQTAYANGHQKEVFELLSRFGNGAKSFRELQPDAFLPIREAIDKGALT